MKHDLFVRKNALFLLILTLGLSPACSVSENAGSPDSQAAVPQVVVPLPLGPQPLSLGNDAEHPALQNAATSAEHEIDLGWVVHAGDQIEIRPTCIEHERRAVPQPSISRTDHPVCVSQQDVCTADEPIIQNQCKNSCKLCTKCEFLFFCHEALCCTPICNDVTIGRRCVQTEKRCVEQQNQWQEETQYLPLGQATHERNMSPMKESTLMLSGLKLKLSFPGTPASDAVGSCPLSQYQPKVDADRLIVTLRDQPGCPASFAAHPGQAAHLSLVNEMSEPIHYRQGVQIKSWDGKLIEHAVDQTYSPEIDFKGTITPLSGVGAQ